MLLFGDWEGMGVTVGFLLSSFPEGLTDLPGVWLVAGFVEFWVALDGDSTVRPSEFAPVELLPEGAVAFRSRLDLAVLVASASNTLEGLISEVFPRLS